MDCKQRSSDFLAESGGEGAFSQGLHLSCCPDRLQAKTHFAFGFILPSFHLLGNLGSSDLPASGVLGYCPASSCRPSDLSMSVSGPFSLCFTVPHFCLNQERDRDSCSWFSNPCLPGMKAR